MVPETVVKLGIGYSRFPWLMRWNTSSGIHEKSQVQNIGLTALCRIGRRLPY
jgi:hypothetical protein